MKNIFDLEPKTLIVAGDPYIASYPHLLAFFHSKTQLSVSDVVCGAHMVYGWMPTILELYQDVKGADLPAAAGLLTKARAGKVLEVSEIRVLASLINNSVVGASKLLHFVAPATYAIWDSKVYSFVHGKRPYNYRVNNATNYVAYLQLLSRLSKQTEFEAFQISVNAKVGYAVSPFRALELVMFLNAPDNQSLHSGG